MPAPTAPHPLDGRELPRNEETLKTAFEWQASTPKDSHARRGLGTADLVRLTGLWGLGLHGLVQFLAARVAHPGLALAGGHAHACTTRGWFRKLPQLATKLVSDGPITAFDGKQRLGGTPNALRLNAQTAALVLGTKTPHQGPAFRDRLGWLEVAVARACGTKVTAQVPTRRDRPGRLGRRCNGHRRCAKPGVNDTRQIVSPCCTRTSAGHRSAGRGSSGDGPRRPPKTPARFAQRNVAER